VRRRISALLSADAVKPRLTTLGDLIRHGGALLVACWSEPLSSLDLSGADWRGLMPPPGLRPVRS
jgi:hypothetical protein